MIAIAWAIDIVRLYAEKKLLSQLWQGVTRL
jgi:hypothetical protein